MPSAVFSTSEIAAMNLILKSFHDAEPSRVAIDDLLARLIALVDADHAEVSRWATDKGGQSVLIGRAVHDPLHLSPPPCILPAGERPESRGRDTEVRTWTTDATPGWGGSALLSVRVCPDQSLLLLALRRLPDRAPFGSRQAAMIDALYRCDLIWRIVMNLVDDPQNPPRSSGTSARSRKPRTRRLSLQFA